MQHKKGKFSSVTIIIATYRRGHLLNHVLEALTIQTSKDFEVLMIVKPSGDGTEQMIEKYSEKLNIKIISQTHGYVTDALNLGLKCAEGEIIVFLDDDAIPFPNLIQSYISAYSVPEVGGVAGDVIPVTLEGSRICPFEGIPSEILPIKSLKNTSFRKFISYPVKGLENYMLYLSKAGFVSLNYGVTCRTHSQLVNSLLAKGANMSISSKAVIGFQFPTSWIFGLTFEQYLGWYLWKKGYRVIFNSKIKVYHIHHGQSLSRNIRDPKKAAILCVEDRLLFYRLYESGSEFSMMHRLSFLLIEAIVDIKNICLRKETFRVYLFKTKFFAELIGLRWLIYKKLRLNHSPLSDLEKMLRQSN